MLLIDGTFYHLWYFPACITGLLLVWLLRRFLPLRAVAAAAGILYLIGLLGDSYYGLTVRIPVLSGAYDAAFQVFSYTRNGFFLAPVFLILGAVLGRRKNQGRPALSAVCLAVSLALMTAEAFLLRHFALQRHDSMYVFLVPAAYFLYRLLLSLGLRPWKAARPAVHRDLCPSSPDDRRCPGSGQADRAHRLAGGQQPDPLRGGMRGIVGRVRLPRPADGVEETTGFLLRPRLDRAGSGCSAAQCGGTAGPSASGQRLMPAVKANAYGHGAVPVARELNRMGIRSFCVATVAEGRELRCGGVRGEILVLGYTHPGSSRCSGATV